MSRKKKGKKPLTLYFDQIPKGYTIDDYPSGTIFILDDTPPKRDPVTFKLIRPEPRPKVYPPKAQKSAKKG
jgi:hypothetical protein